MIIRRGFDCRKMLRALRSEAADTFDPPVPPEQHIEAKNAGVVRTPDGRSFPSPEAKLWRGSDDG